MQTSWFSNWQIKPPFYQQIFKDKSSQFCFQGVNISNDFLSIPNQLWFLIGWNYNNLHSNQRVFFVNWKFKMATSAGQRCYIGPYGPLWHIILIPGQTGFDLSLRAVGLAEKQQIPILLSFISHQGGGIWFLCVKSWFFTPNTPKIFRGGAHLEAWKFLRYFMWKITILRQRIIFFPIVEGGAKILGVFRVKNHDFTPKNNIFSNCGGRRENIWGICQRVNMSLHFDTLFWFLFNQSLFLLLSDACLAEKQQYQF
jgi:hypothetical protein